MPGLALIAVSVEEAEQLRMRAAGIRDVSRRLLAQRDG